MINVFGSSVGKEELDNISKCIHNQWLGFGEYVKNFEDKFKMKYNLKNFAMLDSGSNALFMAITLLDLPKNSEIILPSFTWVSCAQAVILAGHRPVFCDVDLETMNVRAVDIEKQITGKTRAIMIVDYAGLPVESDIISQFGYPIIEDAAHAVHSIYKGKSCGALADVAIYSFDAVKNLTTGEGGGITSLNKELIKKAKVLRYCGIGKSGFESASASSAKKQKWWEYNIEAPFIKMLPTNMAAAIGLAQIDKIDKMQEIRKNIWGIYQNEFNSLDWINVPVNASLGDRHSYFTYCIRVPKRDKLAHYLLDNGIYSTLRYHPLHMNKIYKQINKNLINCETLNTEALNIPIHPRLTENELTKIVDTIKAFEKKIN